jgi:hypothetical protein
MASALLPHSKYPFLVPSATALLQLIELPAKRRLRQYRKCLIVGHEDTSEAVEDAEEEEQLIALPVVSVEEEVELFADEALDVSLPYHSSFELCWADAGWDTLPITGDKHHRLASI